MTSASAWPPAPTTTSPSPWTWRSCCPWRGSGCRPRGGAVTTAESDLEMRALLEAIYTSYHHDFRGYAPELLKRRLPRALNHFGLPTLSALRERLLGEPDTFPRLLSLLTIPVSDMFRDPE